MRILSLALLALLALAAPRAARAADGTTDLFINPATGATITAAGSYRLVSDVTMTANVVAINITVANVTLDLGGHTLTGFAGNTIDGIVSTSTGVAVMNGTVLAFGDGGVDLTGSRSSARNVRATGNNITGGSAAIQVGDEGTVEGCVASGNIAAGGSTVGVQAGLQSRIAGNIVQGNSSGNSVVIGILTSSDCVITDNTVANNVGSSGGACSGINTGLRCIIRGNGVANNDNIGAGNATGISALAGCIIERNSCALQTTAATGGAFAIGISAAQCTAVGNQCNNNTAGVGSNGSGVGLSVGSNSLVRDNVCVANNGLGTGASNGIVVTNNCRVEGNHCAFNVGGAASHAIRVTSTSNLIAGNATSGHANGGIIFLNTLSNRCERNYCDETEVVESTAPGVAPSSLGAGDLANILF